VHARGVAVEVAEIGQHRLHHLWSHTRGGVIVHIDGRRHSLHLLHYQFGGHEFLKLCFHIALEGHLGLGTGGAGAAQLDKDGVAVHINEFDIAAVLFEGRLDLPIQGLVDELDLLDDDLDFDELEDDFPELDAVGTKLDLAKAYIDMGDMESASSILNEVIDEGDDEQKSQAKSLLEQTNS